MDIFKIFRIIFRRPNNRYKTLYAKYSKAEIEISRHIKSIEPFRAIDGHVKTYLQKNDSSSNPVNVFVPYAHELKIGSVNRWQERLECYGITEDDYDTIMLLCQRAELAQMNGEHEYAKTICSSIEEIASETRFLILTPYFSKLKANIK